MKPIQITKRQLQLIQLSAMGLLQNPQHPANKDAIMDHIRSIGYLQIDTMQAVARAPYHILWSHVGHYDPAWLDELLAEKAIFEFWGHALCFLPIELFPVMRGLNLAGERPSSIWEREILEFFPTVYDDVIQSLKQNGPMCSADFPSRELPEGYHNSWGGNKPEKLAMQRMWNNMELMIAYRKKFRRYYDLRERVQPDWDDANALPPDEAHFSLIAKSVKALGVATPKWTKTFMYLGDRYNGQSFINDAEKGAWIPIQVEDWASPAYMHPENLPLLEQAQKGDLEPTLTTLLCPFDPLLNDRDRLEEIWDFRYRIECYVPKAKREYGYFVLPILHKGQLVGRMDSKAWRKEKNYEIIALYLEPGIVWTDEVIQAVRKAVWDFAHWQKLKTVTVTHVQPADLLNKIKAAFQTPLST